MLKTGHYLSEDEIRRRYDVLSHLGCISHEFLERVLALGGNMNGLRVLDVGCGRGELLAAITARFPDTECYGFDISHIRLQKTAKNTEAPLGLVEADMQRPFPFRTQSFDVIFCTECLEHLKDPIRCLRELARVLKPHGRAIITVPNATGYAPFHYFGRLIPGRWLRRKLLPYEHPVNTVQPIDTCFTFREILGLIRAGGLGTEAITGYRYFRYLHSLPVIRDLYRPAILRTVEEILPRVGGVRFAYNLIIRCRVVT